MQHESHPDTVVSEAALQAALAASGGMGAWEWNLVHDSAKADPVVALLFNLSPARSRSGVPFSVIAQAIHPEDRLRINDIIQACVREGTSYIAEYRVCSPSGRVRWVLSRGCFRLDQAGQPLEGRGIVLDITDLDVSTRAFAARTQEGDADSTLNHAADLGLGLYGIAEQLGSPRLKELTRQLLFELGRKLAQSEAAQYGRKLN